MKDGFTLVEVLVITAILSFIIAAIFGVLNLGRLAFHEDMALLDLQQQARQATAQMVKEIRESRSSEISILDNNTKISFKVPPQGYGSPWVGPIEYYRDVGDINSDGVRDQIIHEYPQGTRKISANYISALNFSLSGDILEIRLAAQKSAQGRALCFPAPCEDPRKTLRETVMLRNKNE